MVQILTDLFDKKAKSGDAALVPGLKKSQNGKKNGGRCSKTKKRQDKEKDKECVYTHSRCKAIGFVVSGSQFPVPSS